MAARYWVTGGNGNWSSTTNWSTASGGASGASVPGAADAVIFNASSGSGTATVDSSVTIQTLTTVGFTGTLAFGTNTISLNSTGTVYFGDSTYSVTGTPVINVTSTGSTAITVRPGSVTESNSVSFNFTGGTYSLTFLASTGYTAKNVNFTGFAGTWVGRTVAHTIYGSLTFSTGMTISASTGVLTLGGTFGTQTITSNGKVFNGPINMNGVGGTVFFADASGSTALTLTNGTFDLNNKTFSLAPSITMITGSVVVKNMSVTNTLTHTSGTLTLGSANTFNDYALTAGTLSLSSYTMTINFFSSSNANVRTINFGTGAINCTSTATVWNTATVTNLTVSGTPTVNVTNAGSTAIIVSPGALSEANSISFNFTAGTYSLTFLTTAGYTARNINFTGFAGTWAGRTNSYTIYGSLTLASGMTFAASSGVLTLGATSGTQVITTNGKTFDGPITVNGVGGTVQLADALTMGATRALLLNNGTFDGNNKTISGASSFTMATGSVTAKSISTALAFAHSSGTLTQGAANTTGNYTLTAGTLDLAGFTLTTPSFITATGTKNLTFNAGTLAVTDATTTAWNNAAPTGFTTTAGTGTGKISMTAATAKTFVGGGSTYNCTLSNDGAGALTISGSNTFSNITNGVQPTSFVFTSSTTQTLTNWSVSGTSGNLVTITSSTAGTAATLSKSSGTVSSNYLSLKDSAATGGAAWYAGANSTNVSGNSGWIFSNAPAVSSSGFFFMFGA